VFSTTVVFSSYLHTASTLAGEAVVPDPFTSLAVRLY